MSTIKSPNVFGVCRTIFDDPDFAPEPFTQREAFMWLVASAAWAEFKVRGMHGPVTLQRGEFCFAIRFLAERFQWSKSRVERFISMLKNRDTLRDTSRDNEKVYFIKNYNHFQVVGIPKRDTLRDTSRDSSGTEAGQQRDKDETVKTVKAVNKEKIETKVSTKKSSADVILEILAEVLDAPHSQAVLDYRRTAKKPLTEHSARLLVGKLQECRSPNDAADEMILRGWTSVSQSWLDKGNPPSTAPPKSAFRQHQDECRAAIDREIARIDGNEHSGKIIDLWATTG